MLQNLSKLVIIFLTAAAFPVHGQDLLVGDAGGGSAYVNEYTLSGQPVDEPLAHITGAGDLEGIAVSGNDLFTADSYNGTVGEFNLTTGKAINSSYITLPFAGSYGIAVANSILYVTNGGNLYGFSITGTPVALFRDTIGASGGVAVQGTNLFVITGEDTVGEYNALTGVVENANLVSGLYDTFNLAVSGNDIYTTSYGNGTVSEFTTNGQTVNANFITGIGDGANGIGISNNMLYVTDISDVQVFNATTGAYIDTINADLEQAASIAFTPEPTSSNLLFVGLLGMGVIMVCRRCILRFNPR